MSGLLDLFGQFDLVDAVLTGFKIKYFIFDLLSSLDQSDGWQKAKQSTRFFPNIEVMLIIFD